MWWKKRIRAGVMLYALLMVAVFSLLLQFYLNRQVALARTHKAGEQALIAYSMAHLTKEKVVASLKEAEDKKAKEAQEAKAQASPQEKDPNLVDSSSPARDTEGNADEEAVSEETEAQIEEGEISTSPSPTKTQTDQASEDVAQAPEDNPKTEEKRSDQATREGQSTYNHGQTSYQLKDNLLTVEVRLTTGKNFRYTFHIDSEKP